jgi:hypothetical protein|tara:strand:- start:1610 stop:2134 length:525 start_codon:yes stop_codon:yes gene_type:complete
LTSEEINRDKLIEILEIAKRQRILYGDEALDLDEYEGLTAEDLVRLRDEIDMLNRDARALKSWIDDRIRGLLTNKVMRFGDRVFRGRNSSKLVPFSDDKVIEFLGDDWKAAIRPQFRTTAIKAIAEERGLNPKVILESLFERVETENLEVNPLNKSPKFIQEKLSDSDNKIVDI